DTFSALKTDLQMAAGITGWRWHDFRRSFVTAVAEGGIAEPVADAVLNHRQSATRGGVLGVYQRAQRWPEQGMAMQAWNDALAAALRVRQSRCCAMVSAACRRSGAASRRRRRLSATRSATSALTLPSCRQPKGSSTSSSP